MNDQNPLTRSLQLLWNGLPEPEKGPKPKLRLDQIVEAGVALADAEGLEALSMRRLARVLDVGTMSLYRYVPSKTELLNLMLDSVVGPSQHRLSLVGGDWRTFLTATVHEGRRLYLNHPWTLQANWSRPVLGPNSVADLELFMAGVKDLPLSDQRKMDLATVLDSYAQGTVRQEMMWINAASESGMTDDEFWGYQVPTLEREMTSGRFPMMAALDNETFNSTWEESFEFGLQLLLDGLETTIRRAEQ
ncbi:TetR/AcrR family transcriptional regulator [Nesterenkonia salmonea]|uniref:TetR/AcrR family transcriptional regulator n=1 Tax=Nesterenkonia salmonea TaxID=1804987 RepID=A0A5R9BB11_9MICC|nr:TetR/AcrR family transcriptional regulator [Nesterenkonia salmonea]TLP97434.1 TetR/AcrR family transcriptional regulator [Nesterenkonia salmonea]